MRRLLGCCALFALSAARALAAPPAPGPSQVTIDSIEYGGGGCPPGTAVANVSPDAQAFTIGFSQFAVSAGADVTSAGSAQCHLHLKVTIPKGWSYALARVDYVGYVALDAGLSGWRQSTYHIAGESPERSARYSWSGPFAGDYAVDDVDAGAPLYWSRCGLGKNVMIETTLGIDHPANSGGEAFLTVDAVDGEIYRLLWRPCS